MVPLTWISLTPTLTGYHCLLGCTVRTRNYSICSPLKAASVAGRSFFDEGLAPRNGSYPQYHSGDIRTLHASLRPHWPGERAFHFANLRGSPGFHLLAQGADPLPPYLVRTEHTTRLSWSRTSAKSSSPSMVCCCSRSSTRGQIRDQLFGKVASSSGRCSHSSRGTEIARCGRCEQGHGVIVLQQRRDRVKRRGWGERKIAVR